MKNYYIYSLTYKIKGRPVSVTVIFCPGLDLDPDILRDELKLYYQHYYQAEKTIVIGGNYIKDFAEKVFLNKEVIFRYVPQIEEKSFYENLHILTFANNGELIQVPHGESANFGELKIFDKTYIQQGLQDIFIVNEGLVTSTGKYHHFVFPSGKHADRFLRVANVLLYSWVFCGG
jgi:hypothetical protein